LSEELSELKHRLQVEKDWADEHNGKIKRARRALRFSRKRITKLRREIAEKERKHG
jgi:hypothetical protein